MRKIGIQLREVELEDGHMAVAAVITPTSQTFDHHSQILSRCIARWCGEFFEPDDWSMSLDEKEIWVYTIQHGMELKLHWDGLDLKEGVSRWPPLGEVRWPMGEPDEFKTA